MSMVLLLVISMLLALAFTRVYRNNNYFANLAANSVSRLYGIGSMQIELPPNWQRVPNPQGTTRTGGVSRQFINTQRPDEQLYISLLNLPVITSPTQILTMITQRMKLSANHPVSFTTTVRHGHRTILLASLQDGNDHQADVLLYHIAIFTDTGSQHGVVIFTQSISKRDLKRHDSRFGLEPIELITDIASQAVFRDLQPASAQTLQDAGLANLPEEQADNWMLATTLDGGEHQPVLLLPRKGPEDFWLARVRSSPLLTLSAPDQDAALYSPEQLLMQTVHTNTKEDSAPESTPIRTQSGPFTIWRWTYSTSSNDPHLHGERWYVVQPHDTLAVAPGVLVIDLICSPDQRDAVVKQLEQALPLLQPAVRQQASAAEADTRQAIERGQAIARTLNRDLNKRIPHASDYGHYAFGRQSIGLMLTQTGPGDRDQVMRSRTLLIQTRTPRFLYEQRWAITADASQWWINGHMTVHDLEQPDEPAQWHDRLEFASSTLRSINLASENNTASVNWSSPTPDTFVSSIVLDYFPPEALEAWANKPPALIWTPRGLRKMQAVLMEVRRSANASDKATWQVILRPPAALDPVVFRVNAQGITTFSQWHSQEESGVLSWPYTVRQISREQAIRMFPPLESDIHNWEKEWETP